MSSAALLAFAGVALLCVATPGPTTLLALSNGSRFGLRRRCPEWQVLWSRTFC